MLFSYGYGQWQNQRWHQNAPPLRPVLKALQMRRSNTDSIAQCGMSRATPEATGRHHWATTCSILPQRPPEQQANKQQSTNTPKKVAMLMASAVRQYNTVCIAQWRRSRALLEATGRRHQASIMSNNINWTWLRRFIYVFIVKTVGKGHGSMLRPLFLIGVWHIKRKRRAWLRGLYNLLRGSNWKNDLYESGYCIAFVFVRTVSDPVLQTSIKTPNFVTFYEFLIHLGVHHTTNELLTRMKCCLYKTPYVAAPVREQGDVIGRTLPYAQLPSDAPTRTRIFLVCE